MRFSSQAATSSKSILFSFEKSTIFFERDFLRPSNILSLSNLSLSILFTNIKIGIFASLNNLKSVCECDCTPSLPLITKMAISSMDMVLSISALKSTCPGVSIIFISISSILVLASFENMVIPLFLSYSSLSKKLSPKSTLPVFLSFPVL